MDTLCRGALVFFIGTGLTSSPLEYTRMRTCRPNLCRRQRYGRIASAINSQTPSLVGVAPSIQSRLSGKGSTPRPQSWGPRGARVCLIAPPSFILYLGNGRSNASRPPRRSEFLVSDREVWGFLACPRGSLTGWLVVSLFQAPAFLARSVCSALGREGSKKINGLVCLMTFLGMLWRVFLLSLLRCPQWRTS